MFLGIRDGADHVVEGHVQDQDEGTAEQDRAKPPMPGWTYISMRNTDGIARMRVMRNQRDIDLAVGQLADDPAADHQDHAQDSGEGEDRRRVFLEAAAGGAGQPDVPGVVVRLGGADDEDDGQD